MITVLSPAKTLDFESACPTKKHSEPDFLDDAQILVDKLATFSEKRLAKLMDISGNLASVNAGRFRSWKRPFNLENAKPALLAFKGDVYTGFDLPQWKPADYDFAQKHLRILSGLYGVLRPLDLMQAYRLEMGTALPNKRGKNLYAFWGARITGALNDALKATRAHVLVNLASNEYFSSVVPSKLDAEVVTPVFKDEKNGHYKVISFFAKKARGMMADFIIRNRILRPDDLKTFDAGEYVFDDASSTGRELVFLRAER
jgi:cytoplasmic iron level regulating protein YaaA (DUF328/UPF0246 family)